MLTTDEFFVIVMNKLKNKEPFSFCRMSDGETMLLNRDKYYEEYIRIVGKLWGYVPKDKRLKEVANYLIEALRKSDIVGFPTSRHLARADYFADSQRVYEKYVQPIGAKPLVSVDIAWEMLAGSNVANSNTLMPDYFEELLRDRYLLVYVSCWDLDEPFKRKYGVRHVYRLATPPEKKFTSGYEGENHYPHIFNKIKSEIKTMDCSGALCLVGAGVFSKMYNIWFKEQGGISLDIGSVFDAFKGRSTRGKTRGLDVIDETYKL